MSQVLFNQFAYTDRLTRGGFTPEQARASAEALEGAFAGAVATKSELDGAKADLKSEIERVETSLKSEIDRVETSLKSEIDRVETSLKSEIDRVETSLKSDIDRVETSLKLEIERVETGLKSEIATLRVDAAKTETRLVSEIHSTVHRGVGLLAALMGFAALAAKLWR